MRHAKTMIIIIMFAITVGLFMFSKKILENGNNLTGNVIDTFDECKNAEYPVTISYPAKCNIDGKVFVQRIKTDSDRIIHSKKGDLTLGFKDGKAILTGVLQRSTPCVDWKIKMTEYSDKSKLEFDIYDANKETACVQSLGEPQEIGASASASGDTDYTVMIEEDIAFEGKI
ncbi:MAG: hypothetical protein AABX00_01490 [Nanoarchaeota archaeon]